MVSLELLQAWALVRLMQLARLLIPWSGFRYDSLSPASELGQRTRGIRFLLQNVCILIFRNLRAAYAIGEPDKLHSQCCDRRA